jgi:hypothetical protein
MVSKNPDPGLAPLTRALLEGIPAFVGLKRDGVTIEETTAAFRAWDSAVDAGLVCSALRTLVRDPVVELVRTGIPPPQAALPNADVIRSLERIEAKCEPTADRSPFSDS